MAISWKSLNLFNKKPELKLRVKAPTSSGAVSPPKGRSSTVDLPNIYETLDTDTKYLAKEKYIELIPLIRRSYPFLQNLSLAIQDMVQLTNTGHNIYFDNSTPAPMVKKMRDEINTAGKEWVPGGAGTNSLVNKFLTQLLVGGAMSAEWVPNELLDGLDQVALLNPETIEISVNKRGKFVFYQKPLIVPIDRLAKENLIKLNPLTYKYVAMGGDTEDPRGIPPLVSALEDLGIQRDMMKNIRFIIKQVGILGFIELLMDKPTQNGKENEVSYEARLKRLLTEAKTNLTKGTSDGVLVGFQDDHEYNFHSTSANISGLDSLYGLNQKMVANGLKYSGSFLGTTESTDTNITIVFTKMLSQLKNMQLLVKTMLEFGYTLHLRLKGYNFKNLTVEFNPSTISDDLKLQQAMEIKIRNHRTLYSDGIISLEEYADALGYEKPDQAKPRAPIDPDGSLAKEEARKTREKKKDDSDRRSRDKKTPQPKRRDTDSRTP